MCGAGAVVLISGVSGRFETQNKQESSHSTMSSSHLATTGSLSVQDICYQVSRLDLEKGKICFARHTHILQRIVASEKYDFHRIEGFYFLCSYLDETLSHLLNCLKRERERPLAFQAIGLIAVSVQADINRDLPRIMDVIRASLPSKELTQKQVLFL